MSEDKKHPAPPKSPNMQKDHGSQNRGTINNDKGIFRGTGQDSKPAAVTNTLPPPKKK